MQQENTQVVGIQVKRAVATPSRDLKSKPMPIEPHLLNQISGGVAAKTMSLPNRGW